MNQVIILAGGKGTRMNSHESKTLLKFDGKAIINRLLESVSAICDLPTIIVGFGSEKIIEEVGKKAEYVYQPQQLGTGHAVSCAKEKLEKKELENIVVLPGDHPLVSSNTTERMILSHDKSKSIVTLAYVTVPNFEGIYEAFYNFGRIVRNEAAEVIGIVELKDASEEQKRIKEVNTSYYCFNAKWLWENIGNLQNENAANEYYLTDMVALAVKQKEKINGFLIEDPTEAMGVNTPEQKKIIEDILRKRSERAFQ